MSVTDITKNITKGQVLRYMFMPQVMPRLNAFYSLGFGNLAYLIALVYRAVNILPANHPVFLRENRDKLGLRYILGAAAAELKFTRSEIDKVVIYFVILIGIILLAAQFLLVLAHIMMNPALAGATMPTTYAQFFSTPNYDRDVAYGLLYRVFGVPELFAAPGSGVRPFHTAMYAMFQLYSIGLLVIAVIITSYLVFAIVVETAETGVPFGKRYNHVWAPIRLVVALGLLVPVGYGLNAAQWITLYSAKFGSDFATRGWIIFSETMNTAYLRNPNERVAKPQAPQITNLAAFMMTVDACRYAYERYYYGADAKRLNAYLVKNTADGGAPPMLLDQVSFVEALEYFNNGDIMIAFGEHNPTQHGKSVGNVYPYCGNIVVFAGDATEAGARDIQVYYFNLLKDMYFGRNGYEEIDQYAQNFVRRYTEDPRIRNNSPEPPVTFKAALADRLATQTETAMKQAVTTQTKSKNWEYDQAQRAALGWGGAGLYYNKIAQINGSLVTAANNVPQPMRMPAVMEYMKREQLQQNTELPESFKANLADGREVQFENEIEKSIGKILSYVWEYWSREDTNQGANSGQIKQTNNVFIDVINAIFGTRGLFDMCQSAEVHPLAQLSVLGKGLVEASIRNLGLAVGAGALGMLPVSFIGVAGSAASSILLSVASITITLGFILFYVLPFMPFLYFFFAVGGWIKGLFEAMVGVPLWALAHLRIDGEGLPGDAAMSGYYLIFEIFLRPILIVFGLLASVVIFAAMVKVLNEIFMLVVVNLAGHDENTKGLCGQLPGTPAGAGGGNDAVAYMRGPVDELFFTIIYAIIVYMIGMSCFKLIDLVPNNILRYMNASVNTFNDTANDPADGLMTRLSVGGKFVSGEVMGIGSKFGSAGAGFVKAGANMVNK